MAEISHDELKREIHAVLKTADLNVMSAKKIREQVEKKLSCSLLTRKKECDDIVMDYINEQEAEEDEEDGKKNADKNESDGDGDGGADAAGGDDQSEDESGSEEIDSEQETKKRKSKSNNSSNKKKKQKTPAKAPASKKRTSSAKKKKWSSNASDSDSTSDDDDSDYEQPKAKKTKKKGGAGGGGGGAKRQTGFTRPLKLSPDLAALVGADSMSRHEVVKKVWSIIKERQLADPKNKQYTICDDQLYTVMKVERFRTFGMLKHLNAHFIN